jgi:hypothetical protein
MGLEPGTAGADLADDDLLPRRWVSLIESISGGGHA